MGNSWSWDVLRMNPELLAKKKEKVCCQVKKMEYNITHPEVQGIRGGGVWQREGKK